MTSLPTKAWPSVTRGSMKIRSGGYARRRPPLQSVLYLLALIGCDTNIGPNATATPIPVIQCLLIAGDTAQTAWVEWRIPAESAFGPDVRPVDTALVHLSLVLPDSTRVPFTPVQSSPGRFDAGTTVTPGATYRLEGTVAGGAVTATTVTPGPLNISNPAQDTVHVPAASCSLCSLAYQWSATGSDTYLVLQSSPATGQLVQGTSVHDTVGSVFVFRTRSGPDTVALSVMALDPHAAAFLLPTTPKSSISGVFGLFGAASRARRWVVWE